jgi:hypothetical protein
MVDTTACRLMVHVADVPAEVAVSTTDCALLTEAALAVNDALVAVAGTVTELGSVTALLLLASPTLSSPVGAGPDKLTVHESANDPVIEVLLQVSALKVGAIVVPVPLRLIVAAGALLEIDNCPVTALAVVGLNRTVNTVAWPGVNVAGKLPPDTENPVPEIESELILAAAVPLEVTVTDFVIGAPTETLPNVRDVALRVNAGVAALSWSEIDLEVLPVVAVSATDCALLTDAAVAVNDALVAVAGTVTELGSVTALLLLASPTLSPPVGAGTDKLTMHESANDPVIEVLLQVSALKVGAIVVPVPLRLIVAAGALLEIDNCPVTALAVAGSN